MTVHQGANVGTCADAARPPACQLRICLAASGGGHIRQLLDLRPIWQAEDHFFITEDTALGQSLRDQHRVYFLPHFAWGQFKLGAPVRMLAAAVNGAFKSFQIIMRERPDVLISTGAGAVFFVVLLAKFLGARIIIIESFARFEQPSLFGRLAAPLADELIIQSERLRNFYPRARVFDPFRIIDAPAPAKEPLLFATVGATLPFDRLVDAVTAAKADGLIPERVVIQAGVGGRRPADLETAETYSFDEMQATLQQASIVVCHGGTGSLITALRVGCHVVAMPRLAALGEHYDDHQSEITEVFEERGLVLVAKNDEELRLALAQIRDRDRVRATTDPRELIDHLRGVLHKVRKRKVERAA